MFKTIEECAVEVVSHSVIASSGDVSMDLFPATAARVSFGNDLKIHDTTRDIKLINYLADHQHMTPFEYQTAVIMIECPLFIRSQIMRHRTFSYSEISRRYTDENLEFWIPDKFRKQSGSNKQASTDEEAACPEANIGEYVYAYQQAVAGYERLRDNGVCREQARAVLPQSLLTKFYMGGNLRNWAHFIELRRDPHAQMEVQVVAERVAEKLRELWPESCKALGI